MRTRIISLDFASASMRRGLSAPKQVAPKTRAESQTLDLDKPTKNQSPRGRAGWLSVQEGVQDGKHPSRFASRIADPTTAHGFSPSDITSGMLITVDNTKVTLSTAGSYTSREDILSQLAKDISDVTNVRAQWNTAGSRFVVQKTDNRSLNLAVGTGGSTTDQNQGLLTLLQNSTPDLRRYGAHGKPVDTGRIKLEGGWSQNAVVINGVPIQHYYTDTFSGRIDAINEVQNKTGVSAHGQAAHLESTVSFLETEGAASFSYKSMSVNGVEIILREFVPGESEEDVVTDIVSKLGYHTRHNRALSYLDVYSEGTTVHLDAQDLEHGIVIDAETRADLFLADKMGGRRFDGPSIRLETDREEEILVSMPSNPSSYLVNPIADGRPDPILQKTRESLERLLVQPPGSARLYMSHGLLSGEQANAHSGNARRISHGEETLARGPGGIMEFKSSTALEAFRSRAAWVRASGGYQFEFKREEPQENAVLNSAGIEREEDGLPASRKMKSLDELYEKLAQATQKKTGSILDAYSRFGISDKK